MKRAAHPFAALLGLQPPACPPLTTSASVVVSGRRITDVRQLDELLGVDDPLLLQLRHEVRSTAKAARDRRAQLAPGDHVARDARLEAKRAYAREYMKAWRLNPDNQARLRQLKAESNKRKYHADPEAARARYREWYDIHREEILARAKARREAKKQAKATANNPHDERTVA